jgi:hypothetical protein
MRGEDSYQYKDLNLINRRRIQYDLMTSTTCQMLGIGCAQQFGECPCKILHVEVLGPAHVLCDILYPL